MRRETLIERRLAAGLSQAELAAKVGTTVTTISRLETGAQEDLSGELMLAIAEHLGFKVDKLRGLFARGEAA